MKPAFSKAGATVRASEVGLRVINVVVCQSRIEMKPIWLAGTERKLFTRERGYINKMPLIIIKTRMIPTV